ncbi:MAG: hypothetical protein SPJ29_03995 [Phocaeicola sp.]|nr:hypothetical protein [Prevotellaceae bacterium]MDY3913424.1 hypothetical protein [Phocaeicola sp.]MDY5938899.1 hypothetical protein [Phocaeicola sp.]
MKEQENVEQLYVAPRIEVVDIEMSQNILAGSGDGVLPDFGGQDW